MSYILDALRRAESERERGSVPGLHAQAVAGTVLPATGTPARAGAWTLPAIAALAVAVGLLGWRPWAADRPEPSVPPAPAAPPPSIDATTTPVPAARALVPRAADVPARNSLPPVAGNVGAAKKRVAPAASGAGVAAAPAASSVAGETKIASLAELPDDVRRDLPPLTIGGASYSASPASRFVIVNGQLFREGDAIAPGVVLQQIRLKSAVLGFRGYRYLVTF